MKMTAVVSGSVAAALFAVATVYLGIFAYNNPDPAKCWVVKGSELPATTKAPAIDNANQLGLDVPSGYPVEMHRLFSAWFTWGFYLKIVFIAAIAVATALSKWEKKYGMTAGAISVSAYVLNAAGWIVAGAIWRFSNAGAIASGEKLERPAGVSNDDWDASIELATATNGYQVKSATFMKIYVILAIVVISLSMIGGIIGAFWTMCNPSKGEDSSALLDKDKSKSDKGDKDDKRKSDKRSRDKSTSKKDKDNTDLL